MFFLQKFAYFFNVQFSSDAGQTVFWALDWLFAGFKTIRQTYRLRVSVIDFSNPVMETSTGLKIDYVTHNICNWGQPQKIPGNNAICNFTSSNANP